MPVTIPLSSWMAHVANQNIPLSHLSIPGTHDSCAKSSVPLVPTQSLTIPEQADQGIRFFDFRVNLSAKKNAVLVHGDYPLGLRLVDVLQNLCDVIFSIIYSNQGRWRLGTDIPNLSDIRGKIQLVRRFPLFPPHPANSAGLDVTKWKDNDASPFNICATPGNFTQNVRIQDKYSFSYAMGGPWKTIPLKFGMVKSLMEEAASQQRPDVWYFNYTSAVTAGIGVATPWDYAQGFWDDERGKYCEGVNSCRTDTLFPYFSLPIIILINYFITIVYNSNLR
ncbi:PLC-like phosphodiesterase [Colletotrichum eremochloae]|nr:PLC-like phosphodiesterase [Colletotrichum eremochloae]